jgi:transposase
MWLTTRLAPDHKTIADFRKENGAAIRKVCARFVALCRQFGLLAAARTSPLARQSRLTRSPRRHRGRAALRQSRDAGTALPKFSASGSRRRPSACSSLPSSI